MTKKRCIHTDYFVATDEHGTFAFECAQCGAKTQWVSDEPFEQRLASLPSRFSLRYQFDEHCWTWSNGNVGGSGTLEECIAAMQAENRK